MRNIEIYHEQPPCDKSKLANHMDELKDIMIPTLVGRVDLDLYVDKLSKHADIFYALEDGRIIGSCIAYLNTLKGFITSIGIIPNYEGVGIGTMLLNELVQVSEEKSIREIELKVYKYNEKAVLFYKNYGFKIIEDMDEWYTMKSII